MTAGVTSAMRPSAVPTTARPLVDVKDLSVAFSGHDGMVHAVNRVSFVVMPGEVLCLIGESGSGKSVTLRALMGLLPKRRAKVEGAIRIAEHDILALDEQRLAQLRGSLMAMIFQEPMTALDPVYTIGDQIAETVRRHAYASRQAAMARALELLQLVKVPLPERRLKSYPHELSGGMRQRAMIAIALACQPALLLADEPTTALDATVQIQVLILLRKLQQEFGMGLVFVTHDLGVAAQVADRIAVMYAGRIVEEGSAREVLRNPRHPYTIGMLASTLHGRVRGRDIDMIPGSPPDMRYPPDGCAFAPRCRFATTACREIAPVPVALADGRMVACLRAGEISSLAAVS